MPDTGPPYFIPYADPSDLVRDWPALSEDIADAVADATPRGLGLNVAQSVLTDVFTTTSTSFTTVTGLSVDITPSRASSKVLVIAQVTWAFAGGTFADNRGHFKVTRGGTDIYVGLASGSRVQAVYGGSNRSDNSGGINSNSIVFLDTPNTTSPTTYRVESRIASGGVALYVNRSTTDTDDDAHTRGASSITAIEVAA